VVVLQDLGAHSSEAKRTENAADMTQAAMHCERLVCQFLTLARQHVPERTAVDLNALITDTLELLLPALRVANIAMVLRRRVALPHL
jgi:hypothetical protein